MTRRRFSASALMARLEKYGRCCATCGIATGGPAGLEWDHVIPLAMGGDDTLDNLQPLCRGCHVSKTAADKYAIAKSKRMQQRAAGIKRQPRNPLPGSRNSQWKKCVDGRVIRREEDA